MNYKCFMCNHEVGDELVKRRVRCPYCGSKIIFKKRSSTTKVKAV